MKKFWKIFGITILSLLVIIDLAFVFILPNVIDLNQYTGDLKKLVKEQTKLDLDITNPKVITTPLFGVGVKTDGISVKLPDGSPVFVADGLKTRIALPSIFVLTAKVSCFEITNPFINLEIVNDENFKIVNLIEDIINTQKEQQEESKTKVNDSEKPPFDISMIRIKVPDVNLKNYKVLVKDLKSGHYLDLHGDELHLGYFNGKSARIKTNANFYSDDKNNINLNIDVDTFLPPVEPSLDEEDDPAQKIEIPFVNPVTMYRNYDLKANLNTKLRVRQSRKGEIKSFGYFDLQGFTLRLSNLQLPESYIKAKTFGTKVWLDTNINVAKDENIALLGKLNYGHKPNMDLSIKSSQIYFNDMVILAKAVLDSLHIRNELNLVSANGYFLADSNIKTNFKKLKSSGKIIIKDGALRIRNLGNIISKANINILLDNSILNIDNSSLYIDNSKVTLDGSIDEKSVADIEITTKKIPLTPLFTAFAPKEIRNSFKLSSGNLGFDFSLKGKLKDAVTNANFVLDNINFYDNKKSFVLSDGNLSGSVNLAPETLSANLDNKDLKIFIPQTRSKIVVPKFKTLINQNNIEIEQNKILINDKSEITYKGSIEDFVNLKSIDLSAIGKLDTNDLIQIIGREFAPYIHYSGAVPVEVSVQGNKKKQTLTARLQGNKSNYITPIDLVDIKDQNTVVQSVIDFKPSRMKIKKTGVFTREVSIDDEGNQVEKLTPLIDIDGTIAGNTINLLKIAIKNPINAKLHVFPKSFLIIDSGKAQIFGQTDSPIIFGKFGISNLTIPELLLSMDNFGLSIKNHLVNLGVNGLKLNGSDIKTDCEFDTIQSSVFKIKKLNLFSNLIDVDKLMKVADKATSYAPKSTSAKSTSTSTNSDIPLILEQGNINIKKIKTGNIELTDTTSEIALRDSIFLIDNLRTKAFEGNINGDISINLLSSLLKINLSGKEVNVEKALFDAAGMKDAISGKADFDTDISISGSSNEEIMKNLAGTVNFELKNGAFGPFGKIENMILAENIRESEFFQTALGGVLESLATIDTTHFDELKGSVEFKDGICNIGELTSSGRVLALHIFGSFDLLQNHADMKVRAKLTSIISDLLGPIAMVNPVKLVNSAASMNVFTAKAFSLFCETLSDEEMNTIPSLSNGYVDNAATKFQIEVRGDVAKPLTLVKSFKWLATAIEFEKANEFVSTLPEPVEGSTATTIEEVIKENQALEAEKKTLKYKLKHVFDKKENIKL